MKVEVRMKKPLNSPQHVRLNRFCIVHSSFRLVP